MCSSCWFCCTDKPTKTFSAAPPCPINAQGLSHCRCTVPQPCETRTGLSHEVASTTVTRLERKTLSAHSPNQTVKLSYVSTSISRAWTYPKSCKVQKFLYFNINPQSLNVSKISFQQRVACTTARAPRQNQLSAKRHGQ